MSAVEDRLEILDLIARYSHTIDGRDYDAWVECFTPDGSLHSAMGVSSGHEELKTFAKTYEAARARMPSARHFMTNIAIVLDGETATSRSYVMITVSDPSGVRILFSGQYDDKLVKAGGRWKFKQRLGIPDTSIAETQAHRAQQQG